MYLYILKSYDDTILSVCKNDKDAKSKFRETFGDYPSGNYESFYKLTTLDGYEIHVVDRLNDV